MESVGEGGKRCYPIVRAHTHTHTRMWPLSKCTRCYVTTCLLWTPVGVRVVDDEIPGGGRGRGVTAFAGCVP